MRSQFAPMDCRSPRCEHLRSEIVQGEPRDICSRGEPMNGCCTAHSNCRKQLSDTPRPGYDWGKGYA